MKKKALAELFKLLVGTSLQTRAHVPEASLQQDLGGGRIVPGAWHECAIYSLKAGKYLAIEQFSGEGCSGVPDSKGSGALLNFGRISTSSQPSKQFSTRNQNLLCSTRRWISGQNSRKAFLPISPTKPHAVRWRAWLVFASLSARQVFERKLLPGIAMKRA
jgi:hypothetical protein